MLADTVVHGWVLTDDYAVNIALLSILLKYHDEIWKPPLSLSTHIMEGRVKILETYQNLKKLYAFIPCIFVHLQTFILTVAIR